MRVISFNANGIRSAARKGFFEWLSKQSADIVCVQETRAQLEQLSDAVFFPDGYHCYYYDAQKKGYSGTAIYTKKEPLAVHYGLGWDPADSEARYLQVDYREISFASLYMPSGSSGEQRQQVKFEFLDKFWRYMETQLKQNQRELIISADWNMCHREIDLKNWRANRKNSGFLPQEREWLEALYTQLGYIDSFRQLHPQLEAYTWWSNRGQAYANNVGWRLDYQVTTPGLSNTAQRAEIYTAQRFSDHAPLLMDYAIDI